MSRKAIGQIAQDASGTYVRTIGRKTNGKEARFYLGKKLVDAKKRSDKLTLAWQAVQKLGRIKWDWQTLAIGQAIARGQDTCTLETFADPEIATAGFQVENLRNLQEAFWFVKLSLDNPAILNEGRDEWQQTLEHAKKNIWRNTSQTLHEALQAFSEAERQRNTDSNGTSPHGHGLFRDIQRIKQHVPDMPLCDFDTDAIDAMIETWRQRPITKQTNRKGQPMRVDTCKNHIKRIRSFVRWLHRCKQFEWTKPNDYEVLPVTIRSTHAEISQRITAYRVPTYKVDELTTLWKFARPKERLLILLGLNCSFGVAEVSSLTLKEIEGPKIARLRSKTQVYSEWSRWKETDDAIAWYLSVRPQTTEQTLLVDQHGKSLLRMTAGGNRCQDIPNCWAGLIRRIRKHHPEFRNLSFNKLRKTSQEAIRFIAGGEVARVFASRGQVTSDLQLERYANRDFNAVDEALAVWRKQLEPMFASVPNPWQKQPRQLRTKEQIALSKRVMSMRASGYKLNYIAAHLKLTYRQVLHLIEVGQTT